MPGFDPFRDIDRLLGDVTRTPASVAMPMDLYRTGDDFVAHIDLPGVDPASIDIDMDGATVTVRAERKNPVADEGAQWLARERAVGTFARQLTLGRGLATDKTRHGQDQRLVLRRRPDPHHPGGRGREAAQDPGAALGSGQPDRGQRRVRVDASPRADRSSPHATAGRPGWGAPPSRSAFLSQRRVSRRQHRDTTHTSEPYRAQIPHDGALV